MLRNVSPEQAAALLLRDVYDFSVEEAARMLGATLGQVKNWLQSGRATMIREELLPTGTWLFESVAGGSTLCDNRAMVPIRLARRKATLALRTLKT